MITLEGEAIIVNNPNWERYLREGVIVDLSISRWRAQAPLNLSELGIKIEDEDAKAALRDFVRPGHRLLISKEIMKKADAIEASARWTLRPPVVNDKAATDRVYAYRTHWGAFVPAESFVIWREKFREYQNSYYLVRDKLVADWDYLKRDALLAYSSLAKEIYRKTPQKRSLEAVLELTEFWVDSHFWSREKIAASYRFDYELSYLPMPTELVLDQQTATAAMLQIEVQNQEANTRQRLIAEFELGMRSQLYSVLYESVATLLDMVRRYENEPAINGRIRNKIRAMIEQVRTMDICSDVVLAEQLQALDLATVGNDPADVAVAGRELRLYVETQIGALRLSAERQGREDMVVPVDILQANRETRETVTAEASILGERKVRELA